ncbi:Hsp70 family protein [Ktedonobacter racemifer]|uniref:Heat shock protein 70 n=1 Tax=Ktedonobacter racemifer DSM 44963 TaxID=485913 RepID=D6TW78_KTERA|nr:Hsp70 family protein [Ktedonobacter racemifer]EFH84461.1 Heat shock protein 70 [Ktedonobacter racemifer DSM 44963]
MKIGETIANDLEVTAFLGKGGMGNVYQVHDRRWGQVYALKSPKPEVFVKPGGQEDFVREAETWIHLKAHPHVVACYFVFLWEGFPHILAEYVAGGSLADWIVSRKLYQGGKEAALLRILDVAIQFAWGLHSAHEQGLVHQDIKPANVMMTEQGIVKITDFGLAKARTLAGEGGKKVEQAEQSILVSFGGMTPAYCSPEQAYGRPLSRKTDIWSWGVSILQMFVGTITWKIGAAAREALASHASTHEMIPAMPPELVRLLSHCLQPQPADRPATMAQIAEELQAIYEQQAQQAYPRKVSETTPPEITKLINQANSLLALGRPEAALTACDQALHLDPYSLPQIHLLKGEALAQLGRPEEALGALPWWITGWEPTLALAHFGKDEVLARLRQLRTTLPHTTVVPPHLTHSRHWIGIDFGTTKSCVAVLQDGKPVIIPNRGGARATPSIAARSEALGWVVGEAAQQHAVRNPEQTVFSLHWLIGSTSDDPRIERFDQEAHSPRDIAAVILQQLKSDAENYLGAVVTRAVVTVPVSFNAAQRQVIQDACEMIGLSRAEMITASNAAALAYGWKKQTHEYFVVYDIGGNACNISILLLDVGVFEVKSTNGDTHLGGDDFDQRIVNWLANEFRKEQRIDLRQDRAALLRLKEAAEKAKKDLSSCLQTEIHLPFIAGPKHLTMTLSRTKLEQLVEDLIKRSRDVVMRALSDAYLRSSDVNEVVLVGGQTRMPAVQTMIRDLFGRKPNRGVNPDEAVAIGAAIRGAVLAGEVKDILLLNATPHALGIETHGGVFTPVIKRHTTFPTQKSRVFSTARNNQSSIAIHLLQEEQEGAKNKRLVGSLLFDGIPPAPRGVPRIEITVDVNSDGRTMLSARDKSTGREQKVMVLLSFLGQPAPTPPSYSSRLLPVLLE